MNTMIIGLGRQGMRYYQALDELGVELTCIVDINPDVAREGLPDFPADRISDNAEEMLKKYKIDMAIISTNAAARLQIVKYCIEAGVKRIYCEKPMATNLADADEMIRITNEAECILSINHLRRWSPNHLQLKKLLQDGIIGKIEHFYFQSGSVGLGNVGTHVIDNMRFYSESEVDCVIGFLDQTGTPNPRGAQYKDPGGWGMMMLKDGTRAFIDTCEDTGVAHVFEIVGTYGRVVIEEMNSNWAIYARSEKDRELPLTRYTAPLEKIPMFKPILWDVKEFTKVGLKELIFENKTSCSGIYGLRALEAIIAFHVSHKHKGEKISLPLNKKFYSLDVPWP